VRIFNLGTGAAKDISVEWRFGIDALVEKINQMAQRSFAETYFEHEKARQILSLKTKNGRSASYFLVNDLRRRLDYILPCSTENKGELVRLPGAYVELVSMYLYLFFSEKNDKEFDQKLFNLSLVMTYTDISGLKYSKTLRLKVELMVYKHTEPPGFDALLTPEGSS
jgi:hypothetical protein